MIIPTLFLYYFHSTSFYIFNVFYYLFSIYVFYYLFSITCTCRYKVVLTCMVYIGDSPPALNSGDNQHTFHTAIYLAVYPKGIYVHVWCDGLVIWPGRQPTDQVWCLMVCGPKKRMSDQFEWQQDCSRLVELRFQEAFNNECVTINRDGVGGQECISPIYMYTRCPIICICTCMLLLI